MTPAQKALQCLRLQRGDARAWAAAAVADAPGSAAARLLQATLLLVSRDVRDFEAAGWAYARLRGLPMAPGERGHLAAIAAALDGEFAAACAAYDAILDQNPHDFLALWAAQLMDYYLGNAEALRARSGRVLARTPEHHAVLSLHAFALQECGYYAEAEAAALRALELEPRDLRAQHALLHVYEMLGKPAEALRWAAARSAGWEGAHHMWWHVALFMMALERPHAALAVHDLRLADDGLPQLIDASALLWRLHLQDVEVDARFRRLAARWAAHAEDAYCAFNDLHAMMAFAAAGRRDLGARLLAAQERRLQRPRGSNLDMTRLVGYPACRALSAFGEGDYRTAETLLRSLPPVAHRIGGSHAQRDVLQLTRAAAAARRRPFNARKSHDHALPPALAAA